MKLFITLFFALISLSTLAQNYPKLVALNEQHHFKETVPKGNYSGITWLGGNRYAVVSDKTEHSGFYIFTLDIDLNTGDIKRVTSNGFFDSSALNADEEGIAFHSGRHSVFIAREADNSICEYDLSGKLTACTVQPSLCFKCLWFRVLNLQCRYTFVLDYYRIYIGNRWETGCTYAIVGKPFAPSSL